MTYEELVDFLERKSTCTSFPQVTHQGQTACQKRLGASGLVPRHDLSVKLPTFTVKPVHALVFMRIYQKPERLTIAKGFVATKRG